MKKTLSLIIGIALVSSLPLSVFAAPPALVQHTQVYSGTSKAFSSNVASGDLLLALIQGGVLAGTRAGDPVISDTLGNLWIKANPNNWITGSKNDQWIFYTVATSSGADTISFTGMSSDPGMHISEWSGITASPIAATSSFSTTTSSNVWSSNSFAVPSNSTVVSILGEEYSGTGTLTPANGYTELNHNGGQYSMSVYQQFTSASSSATVNGNYTLTQPYAVQVIILQGTTPVTNITPTPQIVWFN